MIAAGKTLNDKYLIEREIGSGGMGIVLRATHLQLDQRVAIKILRPEMAHNRDVVERFLREARSAAKLTSEHTCRVHDVGVTAGGSPFMVLEYMDGCDLMQLDREHGPLDPSTVIDFILQACEALAEAHSRGIVHRDIKPANFFIARQADASLALKVFDFGISKARTSVDVGVTSTQSVLGTPAYMSPQQMNDSKNVDERTDIWSLGVVLYELLNRRRPFDGDNYARLCVQVATQPVPPMDAALPPGLAAAVMRCLEKDVSQRFQNVAELAAALAPFARNHDDARRLVDRAMRFLGRDTGAASAMLTTGVGARGSSRASLAVSLGPPSTLSASAAQLSSATSWAQVSGTSHAPSRRRASTIGLAVLAVMLASFGAVGIWSATPDGIGAGADVDAAGAVEKTVESTAGQPEESPAPAAPVTGAAMLDAGSGPDSGPDSSTDSDDVGDPAAASDSTPEPEPEIDTEPDTDTETATKQPRRQRPSKSRKRKKSKRRKPSVLDEI